MREVLEYYHTGIESSKVLFVEKLKKGEYFIVSTHREENIDSEENFQNLLETLSSIQETYNKEVIVSTHPRTRKKLEAMDFVNQNEKIRFMKPLDF